MNIKFLFLFLLSSFSAYAEIVSLTITFNPALCNEKCGEMLVNQMARIPTVSRVSVNRPAGRIDITLKQNSGFAYMPFNRAMQYVGLSIKDFWVKAKGRVTLDKGRYVFVSDGDGTTFGLINALVPSAGMMVNPFNIQAADRILTPQMRFQLDEGIRSGKTATLYGPLYFPERAPPLMIVIESIQWAS